MTAKEFLQNKKILTTIRGIDTELEPATGLEELLEDYHQAKLKLLGIANIPFNEMALCDCFRKEKTNMLTGMYCKKHKIFFSM